MIQKLAGTANRNGQLPGDVEQRLYDWQVDDYWRHILANREQTLNMPLDCVRPAVKSMEKGYVAQKTSLELKRKLELIEEKEAVSMEIMLLAAFILLLSKYSGQDQIFVGWMSDSFQQSGGQAPCTSVIAGHVDQEITWREYVAIIEQVCLQALAPKRFSYEELVKTLDLDQDPSRNPLFDVLFKKKKNEEIEWKKYDFSLEIEAEKEGIFVKVQYDTNLFFKSTMERLLCHYFNLLEELVRDADQCLADMDMLSADEREHLVHGLNQTTTEYPFDQSIAHMLEKQIEQRPEEIAVVFGEQRLTYRQLHASSNRIAHALHHRGIGEGDVVVVMAERSLEFITGLLGVLKARAAYTPVDPGYPAERLRYLLRNSSAKLLLVQRTFQDRITDTDADVVAVEDLLAAEFPSENLLLPYDPEQLMYVLYTSGSTGNPKGAMIRSHAFVNLLHWYTQEFTFTENDRVLLIASASFDLAQKNLYAPLITGGRLILFEPGLYDYEQMSATIEREDITVINCTPSAFYPLLEENADDDYKKLKSLRWIFLGGEPIHMTKLGPWLRSENCQAEIVNTYGPTECTDIASYYRMRSEDWQGEAELPIGKPIDNVRLYVVDKEMKIVPEGMEGELCIGGVGVGLGYYNAPELTQERFVQSDELPERVVYRTGDVVKRLPDGNIAFIGRVDHQVKIRGFRIEIEEIEKKLLDHPHVKEAVITAVQDADGDTSLRAYVVPMVSLTIDQIRDYLQMELPAYMVPQFFILLESLPLTPNGKIDRKALPLPPEKMRPTEEPDLNDEIAQQLVALWQEVLGIRKIGIRDSFFRLGGHSLKAIALLSRIKKTFGVSIPIQTLFRSPTVQQLAEVIRRSPKTNVVSIPTAESQEYHRLSSEQERLYVLEQFEDVGTAYNVPWAAHVYGPLDADRCHEAFTSLSRRHESLRTCFEMIGDTVFQKVLKEVKGFFTYEEVIGGVPDQLIRQFVRPFDLSVGPLFRVKVIRLGANEHLFLLDMHHIIADGISIQILLKEFSALYEGKALNPLPMQYKDYANWQNKRRETLQEQEQYWLDLLQGELPVLNLPLDHPRPPLQSFEGDKVSARLDAPLVKKLRQVAEETGTTLYMVLLASYQVLLHKYTGQTDIIVGSPIGGRQQAEFENIVGMFVNTLALRNFPHPAKSFRAFLTEVRECCLKAYEHQEWPFEKLVEKLQFSRDLSRNPLFDTMFVLQNMKSYLPSMEGVKMVTHPINAHISQFDLMLEAIERGNDTIHLNLEFCVKLFAKNTMERLLRHYLNLLEQLVHNVDQRVEEMDMLSADERERLVYGLNQTTTEYPYELSIAHMLEKQVEQRPEEIAVVFGEQRLTYGQLHASSNRIAHALHHRGIGEGDVVVVMAERSLELITGLLGVLKAGAAYTPVDPGYPAERLRYLLRNSSAKLLLVQRTFRDRITDTDADVVAVEDLLAAELTSENLPLPYHPERLMYVLYTSGSTGNPKGAMIRSHAFVNLLHWYTQEFTFTENERVLLIASASFDLAQKNLYAPLITGGRLILFEPGLYDYEQMSSTIEREGITVINCTPSAFYPLLEENADDGYQKLKSLRWVFLGGEPIHMTHLGPWLRSPHCQAEIVNTYGPTECTDIASYYRMRNENWQGEVELPIGKPINNTRLYVVDKEMKIVPEGMEGELCIGGVGVGLGYYNAPELTEERFVQSNELPERVMYKTGDIVKRLPDGNIMFIGRVDHQVKIRGFRIEIEEIEKKLLDHHQVKEAVVTAVQDASGDTTLRAYVVPITNLTTDQICNYLQMELPAYMVPQLVMILEALPLTPNGKIDRKALPLPTQQIERTEENDPNGETEQRLATLWEDVLGISKVSLQDSFFRLGGHSLKAIALLSRIKKTFGVSIPIQTLFRSPTVQQLAEVIRQTPKTSIVSIPTAGGQEYHRLSSEQERLYVLEQFEDVGTAYNVPWAAHVYGPLDADRCHEAFTSLSRRHESLRTCFEMIGDTVFQKVLKEVKGFFTYEEVIGGVPDHLIRQFVRPFDLSVGPLFRVKVIRLGANEHLFLLDMHHIIADGISIQILLKEFSALYEGEVLESLPMQYKDYACWQNKRRETLQEQEQYWLDLLQGELPVLNLPLDHPRPPLQNFEGDKVSIHVDASLAKKLGQVAEETGSTLYMVLLAAYQVLLHKYTGQSDIIVGSPVGGRQQPEFENIVGMFVNTLALRNFPHPAKSFRAFLTEVRECCLKAYEHQEWPFDKLVEKLEFSRDLSRNPLFDTMFVLQNMESYLPSMEGVRMVTHPINAHVSQFDLMLEAIEREDGGIQLNLEYCVKLFAKNKMERLLHHYLNLLEQLVRNVDQLLEDMDMLSADERERLVYGLNQTTTEYPYELSIAYMLENQVEQRPEEIAVVFGEQRLTYRQLHASSNRIAHALHHRGIGEGDVVVVMAERSLELITGLLGVLKAGAAYTPVDPGYPAERLRYLLRNSSAKLLLVQRAFQDRIADTDADMVAMEDLLIAEFPSENMLLPYDPERLMYVLYTSGSTGNPKGAMIRSHAFVNLLHWYTREFRFTENERVLLIASASFDLAQKNLYAPLITGGRLILFEPGLYDYEQMSATIEREGITVINCTPSAFYPLLEENADDGYQKLKSLRWVFLGGEPIHMTKMGPWVRSENCQAEIVNTYGPTECTDIASYYRMRSEDWQGEVELPIGKPIDNVRLYVVDKEMKIVPEGMEGELCIGGVGVGLGYYNAPELTEERFVQSNELPERVVYKTGDIVKRIPDGNVVFIGRVDHQVKIRGFRIEIEEIEKKLVDHPLVKESVVTAVQDVDGDAILRAYVVPVSSLTTDQLYHYLQDELPGYMVPQYLILLESLPLTPNGKIDRKALPLWPDNMVLTEEDEPRGETEQQLAALWQETIGIRKVSVHDHFFQLTDQTFKALDVIDKINKAFGVKSNLNLMIRNPTIRELAKQIEICSVNPLPSLEVVAERPFYPASSAQKRLFMINKLLGSGTTYNVPVIRRMKGRLDIQRVGEAMKELAQRHESLRTSFQLDVETGALLQKVHSDVSFTSFVYELTEAEATEMIQDFVRPFRLDRSPLFRSALIKLIDKEECILIIDMHHSITDGMSIGIILKDLVALYEKRQLDTPKLQYKDYAVWENQLMNTREWQKQEKYWLEIFKEPVHPIQMPVSRQASLTADAKTRTIYFSLEDNTTVALQNLAQSTETTLFMVLMTTFTILLSKLSDQEDIVVGTPISGRHHDGLENIVGMFVNTLAIRNSVRRSLNFLEYLNQVKERLLEAYENQDYPFDHLVDKLNVPREISTNPLFNVVFQFAQKDEVEKIAGLEMLPVEYACAPSKFDIHFVVVQEDQRTLYLEMTYRDSYLPDESANEFIAQFIELVQQIVHDTSICLKKIMTSQRVQP
ncbi:non-ribosomal peptide synthetase [Brevibacillus brevis]|nr:non-ribosomal peptide synthetase [Brevibacillus brevis]